MVAGKARRYGSGGNLPAKRNKFALYGLGRNNDSQIGGEQFSSQEGFTPINQTGLQDVSKALASGSQLSGALGFNFRLCELDSDTSTLDITKEVVSNDVFDTPPGDCNATITGSGAGSQTSDIEFINFPRWQGHRLSVYLNDAQTITVKHTAGATNYAIKTPTEADVVFTTAERVIEFAWSITLGQWLLISEAAGTGGGGCPLICSENNLGSVTGVVDLDWSLANFHRAVLTGDTTFNIINTPGSGDWQDICLEVQQDGIGGHNVSFVQGFDNGFIPMAVQGAGRYTSWQIYTYEEPAGTDVFQGFNKDGSSSGPTVPGGGGQFQGFSGWIHAGLSVDQTVNLAPGAHIEFDTIISSDTLTVSSGAGQASGIFTGFRPGHTYECSCYPAAEGNQVTMNFTCKWFDRNALVLLGSQGNALAVSGPKNENPQHIAKHFFQSTSLADALHVEILDSFAVTSLNNGSVPTEGETYAVIKDCGIIESVINQPEPAPEEGELDIREFSYLQVSPNSPSRRYGGWQGSLQNKAVQGPGQRIFKDFRIKHIHLFVGQKGAGVITFNFEANGVTRGPLFTIPAFFTGNIEFTPLDIPFAQGEDVEVTTIGGVGGQPTGDEWNMVMSCWWL